MHLDQLYFNPPVIIFHFGFFFNHYVPLSSLAVFFNKAKKERKKKMRREEDNLCDSRFAKNKTEVMSLVEESQCGVGKPQPITVPKL